MKLPRLLSPNVALVALSLVAACSLARGFTGPGEIVPAIAAALAINATVIVASRVASRSWVAGIVCAVVGDLIAFVAPIWLALGSATTWGWLTISTFHVLGNDIGASWNLFNNLRAPVPETAGFTVVGAWAVAVSSLLSGWASVDGDTSAWVVAPPAAIFLFTSALGTPTWRGEAIAAEVIALGWYALAARSARIARNPVLATASGDRSARRRQRPVPVWQRSVLALPVGMILVAALLAATVGPRLPGAVSPALVSLRNSNGSFAGSGGVASVPSGPVEISTLVQVADEEIYQAQTTFFTVQTLQPSYMVLTTLDTFDGDRWTTTTPSHFATMPPAPATLAPAPRQPGTFAVRSELAIKDLGGDLVPATPTPILGTGPAQLFYDPGTETVQTNAPLQENSRFSIISDADRVAPSALAAETMTVPVAMRNYLQLPAGVPQSIAALAQSIVRGAHTPFEEAQLLQDFFQNGSFVYDLPKAPTGSAPVVTGGEGLADLVKFLFISKSGFCQQYSSAYAVLARIDGLPTRIAVGFVPGTPAGNYTYAVTGTDVHAWPQVWLGGEAGWTNFEPTPGSSFSYPQQATGKGNSSSPTVTTTPAPKPGSAPSRPRTNPSEHGAGGGSGNVARSKAPTPGGSGGGSGSLGGLGLLYGLTGLGLVVFTAAPVERVVRRRRARSPAARVLEAWRAATASLGLVGLSHHSGESFNDLADRVSRGGALAGNVSTDLALLAGVSTTAAYAPSPPSDDSVRAAVAASQRVAKAARRRAGRWRTIWSFVSPAGLLRRDG